MPKKILRNVTILVCFLIALGGMIQFGKWLLNRKADVDDFDATVVALETGQEYMETGNPDLAIEQFDRVIKDDRYNGYAAYARAVAHRQLYYRLAKRPNSDPKLQQQAADKAVEAFKKCLDFPRFRNRALHSMSRVYARQKDRDRAVEYIERAINDGYVSENGSFMAKNYDNFYYEFLRNDPKLRELQDREAISYSLRKNNVAPPSMMGGKKNRSKRRSSQPKKR